MNEEYFDSYDKIDRHLRNNLDDADYAEFSDALEVVSCADVVESLRQQLAEANHAHEFMSQQYKNLQRRLAAALAAIKAKDDALECCKQLAGYPEDVLRVSTEALATQPDDSALKAWLGEPVRYLYQIHNCYGVPVWVDNYPRYGEAVLETMPLYAPKGLK